MKTKLIFPLYIHYFIYLISAAVFAYYLDISMTDDGLRHIAFAANGEVMKNWGEIFPNSLFGTYDPWFLWHKLISFLLEFVPYSSVHIVINALSFFALMVLLDEYIRRYVNYNLSSLIYIVVFGIVFATSYRYVMVRPDLLSGLFVFTVLLFGNRFWSVFLLTLLYGPFYYLFFLYTGSAGLVFIIQKRWKAFWGAFTASVVVVLYFLVQDFQGYSSTVINILTDQNLRMGLEVREGKAVFPIFSNLNYFILLPTFLGISIALVYYKYEYFSKNTLALFFLITSILWVNQYRYYHLFIPFMIVYLLSVSVELNKKTLLYNIRKYLVILKRYFSFAKSKKLFYFIAIPYAIVMFSIKFDAKSRTEELQKGLYFEDDFYNNKTVLMNKLDNDIYKGLYYNPTVKFIPSCSIGWFDDKDPKMKDIYVRMMKEKGISESELAKLIKYTDADIYFHHLRNEKQELDFEKLRKLGIIPYKIYKNFIIFKISKKKVNKDG